MDNLRAKLVNYVKKQFSNVNNIKDLADDIVNQSIINFYEKNNKYPEETANDYKYLSTICYNLAIDVYKSDNTSGKTNVSFEEFENVINDKGNYNPDEDKLNSAVNTSLSVLNEVEKQIIHLHFYNNLSLKEVSDKLNINFNTVRVYHKRALEKLRPQLKSVVSTEPTEKNIFQMQHEEILSNIKRARILKIVGEYDAALELFYKCLEESEKIHNIEFQGITKMYLGSLLMDRNYYGQAEEMFLDAEVIFKNLKHVKHYADLLSDLGALYQKKYEYAQSLKYYEEAMLIYEKNKITPNNFIYSNLGQYYIDRGEYNKAYQCFQEHSRICKEINDERAINRVNDGIGEIHLRLGDLKNAEKYFIKYLNEANRLEDAKAYAAGLSNIAILYLDNNNYKKAFEYLNKSKALYEKLGIRSGAYTTMGNIGMLYYELGKFDKALKIIKEYKVPVKGILDRHVYCQLINYEALIFMRNKEYSKAAELFEDAVYFIRDVESRYYLVVLLYFHALYFFTIEDYDEALFLNYESKELAIGLEFEEMLFYTDLLETRIKAVKGDKIYVVHHLMDMLQIYSTPEWVAEIYYELYNQTKSDIFREKAINLFSNLYKNFPKFEFKEKIDELSLVNA